MHLDPGQIERGLDPELPNDPGVEEHLAACAECRARLAEARRQETWIRDQLRVLDHAAPSITASSIMQRGKAHRRGWDRLAAGIVLAAALGGVAYAAPGSPLPGVINRLVSRTDPAPRQQTSRPVVFPTGIAVAPGERLTVEFASPGAGDTAVVSLSDGPEVVVRGSGGTTTFSAQTDRLIVRHRGAPGRFEVLVPRDAPSVSVSAGERRLWSKRGTRIEPVPLAGQAAYVVPLSQNPASPAP